MVKLLVQARARDLPNKVLLQQEHGIITHTIFDNQEDIIPTTLHVVHVLMPVVITTVWKDSIEQCPR